MSLSKIYKTDSKKEIEGVKLAFSANDDGSIPTFIVSRTNGRVNQKYAKALERHSTPVRTELRLKTIAQGIADRVVMNAFVEGALHGWENIEKAEVTGNPDDTGFAEYSEDNARALFSRLPELFAELQERANDISNYREDDAAAKN